MSEKRFKATWKHKLVLLLASGLLCLLVLLAGEAFCRLFLNINFRRTSKEFVTTNSLGIVNGNAKNAKGVSFGVDVYSDENGFRINPNRAEKQNEAAVLFLGDSVTFGVGIEEEKTFVGLFRQRLTDVTVYNSAFVGASIPDYERVVNDFIPQHGEVKQVYLFYCLNDFHLAPEAENSNPETSADKKNSLKYKLAQIFPAMNDFFGSRSKLYVYITGKASDPSLRYFQADFNAYNVDDEMFNRIMQPIVNISEELKKRNIKFVVFLNPYEAQLRANDEADMMPQRKLEQFFRRRDIAYVNTTDKFREVKPSTDAFLFADPMHLSERGHKIVFDALWENWQSSY